MTLGVCAITLGVISLAAAMMARQLPMACKRDLGVACWAALSEAAWYGCSFAAALMARQ